MNTMCINLLRMFNPEHWLAMDSDNKWFIYNAKPSRSGFSWLITKQNAAKSLEGYALPDSFFNLPVVDDWSESIVQIKDLLPNDNELSLSESATKAFLDALDNPNPATKDLINLFSK